MVKALIDISNNTNRILKVIKASYDLKDKSQAIDIMAKEYDELVFIPKIKTSYLKKYKKISKEKNIYIGSLTNFDRIFHLKK